MIKVSKNWTKARLTEELFKAGHEMQALKNMRDTAEMTLDESNEVHGEQFADLARKCRDINTQLTETAKDLDRKSHEVWVLRDLLVTLYNDRER